MFCSKTSISSTFLLFLLRNIPARPTLHTVFCAPVMQNSLQSPRRIVWFPTSLFLNMLPYLAYWFSSSPAYLLRSLRIILPNFFLTSVLTCLLTPRWMRYLLLVHIHSLMAWLIDSLQVTANAQLDEPLAAEIFSDSLVSSALLPTPLVIYCFKCLLALEKDHSLRILFL